MAIEEIELANKDEVEEKADDPHDIGGSSHTQSTLSDFNSLIEDATIPSQEDVDEKLDADDRPEAGVHISEDSDGEFNVVSTPDHVSKHEQGGTDEINVDGLSGDLADAQDPKTHGNESHDEDFASENQLFSESYNDLTDVPSEFTPEDHDNDAHIENYLTEADVDDGVTSVNSETGDVVLDASDVGAIDIDERGVSEGVAELADDGKLERSQVPSLAVTEVDVVQSESELTGLDAEEGDVGIVQEEDEDGESFILTDSDSSILGNWQRIKTPKSPVQSVNSQTGDVNLDSSDVGALDENDYEPVSDVDDEISEASNTVSGLDSAVSTNQDEKLDESDAASVATSGSYTDLSGRSHGNEDHDNNFALESSLDDFVEEIEFNDHSSRHEQGGKDELNVDGLSGDLQDPQDPKNHDHNGDSLSPDSVSVDSELNIPTVSTKANIGSGETGMFYVEDDERVVHRFDTS